jgi:hypothetical protein
VLGRGEVAPVLASLALVSSCRALVQAWAVLFPAVALQVRWVLAR